MIRYVLNRYDQSCYEDETSPLIEEVCFEHEDEKVVEEEAIRRCTEDMGKYTYRLEVWKNESMIGSWRFFQGGREFTKDILEALKESLSNQYT